MRNDKEKSKFFPITGKNKKKIYFFLVNIKNITSHVLEISAISLVLCTREITDIFNTFDETYLVFMNHLKKENILYSLTVHSQGSVFTYTCITFENLTK